MECPKCEKSMTLGDLQISNAHADTGEIVDENYETLWVCGDCEEFLPYEVEMFNEFF